MANFPAPWCVQAVGPRVFVTSSPASSSSAIIAECFEMSNGDGPLQAGHATLIASAPELVEALKAMLARWELYVGPDAIHAGEHDKALIAAARAALSKAGVS